MKYITVILLSIFTFSAHAWIQSEPLPINQCQSQAPYGLPTTAKKGVEICRSGYVTSNDTTAKLPIWISYVLSPKNALGCIKRANTYTSDKSLDKGSRAELTDYAKSGYDMGHMAPADDFQWNATTQNESFLLTNMAPQLPSLNRGLYKLLEINVRGWVIQQNHSYVIYVGPIYNSKDKKIGNVVVPNGFYKIVIDMTTKEVAGFLFPHNGNLGHELLSIRIPVYSIEKISGIKFSYPANMVELPTNKIWPVDFGALTKLKQQTCKIK